MVTTGLDEITADPSSAGARRYGSHEVAAKLHALLAIARKGGSVAGA